MPIEVRDGPRKPTRTTILHNGVEMPAVDEGEFIIAFPTKEKADSHYKEMLEEYHDNLLDIHEGPKQ